MRILFSLGRSLINTIQRSNGGIIKKYHLTEFTPPFAPDLERQEMPNSIMMDFRDGRTLQCQTQSLTAQRTVLKSKSHRSVSIITSYN
jgi:hypothetical protein